MPASLEDETNPDWLLSLNVGHDKVSKVTVEKAGDRWKRRKAREESTIRNEAEPALGPASCDDENGGKLCVKGTQTDLTSSMIDHLIDELNQSSVKVCSLNARLASATPFSEEALDDNECQVLYWAS